MAEAANKLRKTLLYASYPIAEGLSKSGRSTLPSAIPESNLDRRAIVAKIATLPASGLGTLSQ